MRVSSTTQSHRGRCLLIPPQLLVSQSSPERLHLEAVVGRQHHADWLLLDCVCLSQALGHTWPRGLPGGSAWLRRMENLRQRYHEVRDVPGRASLLDGACLCPDTCFCHISCPPGGLTPLEKPLQRLAADGRVPQRRTPTCSQCCCLRGHLSPLPVLS